MQSGARSLIAAVMLTAAGSGLIACSAASSVTTTSAASPNSVPSSTRPSGSAGATVSTTTAPTANDFLHTRPGDRLARFVGEYIPSATQALIDARIAAMCKARVGATYIPLEVSDARMLERSSLAAFRDKFGYGVVSDAIDASVAATKGSVGTTSAAPDCDQFVAKVYESIAPPPALPQRADELYAAAMSESAVGAAVRRWQGCMSAARWSTSETPRSAKVLVEALVLASKSRVGGSVSSNTGEGEPTQVALPTNVTDELLKLELQIFAADSRCLGESGAGAALLQVEQRILDTLRAEYPSFTGVSP